MADKNELIGTKIQPVEKPKPEIGIDLSNDFLDGIIDSVLSDKFDISRLNNFATQAQTREQIYKVIDAMAMDDRVSSILETYTEDITETNEAGQVVRCESSNAEISKHINYLLDALNVDKNIYEWTYSLLKYGDVYLKLYRQSDYGEDTLWGKDKKADKKLNEDVYLNVNKESDHYVHYVKMVSNPGEMFDLTKFGKTRGFIKAPVNIQTVYDQTNVFNNYLTYKMKKNDIDVYGATDYVHGCLTNTNATRFPEEVSIFSNEDNYEKDEHASVYEVKRGQSLLYNQFKIWRELSLLENSVMLNRVVTSAIVRIISVEVGNMPKDKVADYLNRLKQNIEQKSALSVDSSMMEYNNPGPVMNTIYIPTHEGVGNLQVSSIGGEYDPKQLTDLSYFLNKFYGGFRVPKQYFSETDDGAGFNGGTSLTILSARYGKAVKSYQNIIIQFLTDLINLFLIDSGCSNYINRFKLRMQAPVTQEEIDRRDNLRNRMGVVNDIMNQINNVVDDKILQVKVLKSLLSTTITSPEVIELLQAEIDKLEAEVAEDTKPAKDKEEKEDTEPRGGMADSLDTFITEPEEPREEEPTETEEAPEEVEAPEEIVEPEEDSYMPSPAELGQNFVDNI